MSKTLDQKYANIFTFFKQNKGQKIHLCTGCEIYQNKIYYVIFCLCLTKNLF